MSSLYGAIYTCHDSCVAVYDADTKEFRQYELERIVNLKHFSPTGRPYYADEALNGALDLVEKDFGHANFKEFLVKRRSTHAGVTFKKFFPDAAKRIEKSSEKVTYLSMRDGHHHDGHAWAGFVQSPFDDAFVITYDVRGDDASITFREFHNGMEKEIEKRGQSIGQVYNIAAKACYSLRNTDQSVDLAGKLMGLAAYGKETPRTRSIINLFKSVENCFQIGSAEYQDMMNSFTDDVIKRYERDPTLFLQAWAHERVSTLADGIHCDGPTWEEMCRDTELLQWSVRFLGTHEESDRAKIRYKRHFLEGETEADWAYAAQMYIEERLVSFIEENKQKIERCGNNIVLSGGCALNVLANEKVKKLYPSYNVYVPPNPHDGGIPLGLLTQRLHKLGLLDHRSVSTMAYNGPEMLDDFFKVFGVWKTTNTKKVAQMLREGKIIGLIQGRSEIGPRALGNRSILCNAEIADMKDIINKKVKHREWYRPFAPVCRIEDVEEYFESPNFRNFETMSFVADVRKDKRDVIPAVTHADGTARLQTVTRFTNKNLYDILTEFGGVLLNTSFNDNGRPILNKFLTAKRILEKTELDHVLYIDDNGDYYITCVKK